MRPLVDLADKEIVCAALDVDFEQLRAAPTGVTVTVHSILTADLR